MRRSDRRALGVLVAGLAAANLARSTVVPSAAHLPLNVSLGLAAGGLGWAYGLRRDELGLGSGWVRRGLRWGAPVTAIILGGVALGALVPATSGYFDDPRGDLSLAELLGRTLVVIPIGTVVVEELAFRGVLLGLARRLTSPMRAAALTAGLFGLWHVVPAWRGADPGEQVGVALGTLVATTGAGLLFGWLRERSDSLLAPALVHVATNSGALVGAWITVR